MSRVALELQQKNAQVLPIFCSSTKMCSHAIDIIQYIAYHLEELLQLPHFADSEAEILGDDKQWSSWLEELYTIFDRRNGKPLTIWTEPVKTDNRQNTP